MNDTYSLYCTSRKGVSMCKSKSDGEHIYQIGRRVAIVTPVYRNDSDKTIHDILISLMKKDS